MNTLTKSQLIGEFRPIAEVAIALNIHEQTVLNTIKRLHIPSVKIVGKRHVRPDEFRKAIEDEAMRNAGRK